MGTPRIESGTAGWEARTLPLSYGELYRTSLFLTNDFFRFTKRGSAWSWNDASKDRKLENLKMKNVAPSWKVSKEEISIMLMLTTGFKFIQWLHQWPVLKTALKDGGRDSKVVAFALCNQLSQVQFSAFPNLVNQDIQCCWDLSTGALLRESGQWKKLNRWLNLSSAS